MQSYRNPNAVLRERTRESIRQREFDEMARQTDANGDCGTDSLERLMEIDRRVIKNLPVSVSKPPAKQQEEEEETVAVFIAMLVLLLFLAGLALYVVAAIAMAY